MKFGRKASTDHLVVYMNQGNGSGKARFGFVVGKTVGNAVERNLVKRRARSLAENNLSLFSENPDLVIRALPGTAQISWQTLSSEFDKAIASLKAVKA
jgi:ribonuclease P protein component